MGYGVDQLVEEMATVKSERVLATHIDRWKIAISNHSMAQLANLTDSGRNVHMLSKRLYPMITLMVLLSACSSAYYSTMEKVGIHKRDIMVDRVESARDAQAEAQEQFQSALDQFASVINLEESDLKQAYDSLNHEFEASEAAASEVSDRIEKVESVAEDLFEEWQEELELYENKSLKASSAKKLAQTKQRYRKMLS
jgi:uncharacterized protein YdiU (UPF0061 family)